MIEPTRLGTAVLALATTAVLLAGCGTDDSKNSADKDSSPEKRSSAEHDAFVAQTTTEIAHEAAADLRQVKTLTAELSVIEDGQASDTTLAIGGPEDCQGRVAGASPGGTMDFIRIPGSYFFKGDTDFMRAYVVGNPASTRDRLADVGDNWLLTTAEDTDEETSCDLVPRMLEFEHYASFVTTTYWMATEGEHLVLRLEEHHEPAADGPTTDITVEFSEFGEPVTVTAPDRGDVVDLDTLATPGTDGA